MVSGESNKEVLLSSLILPSLPFLIYLSCWEACRLTFGVPAVPQSSRVWGPGCGTSSRFACREGSKVGFFPFLATQ